ncbi:MAG: hypothetical protein V1735_05740 [Nanoarchaeota archaeon]
MAIVGFNLTKLSVERAETLKGKISIANNVSIKDIEDADLSLGDAKQRGLKFIFEFSSKFEPEFASIVMHGNVLFLAEAAKVTSLLDGWRKSKKIPQEVMTEVLNVVLTKCNIEALMLSRDFNLPSPVPLPKVEAQKK